MSTIAFVIFNTFTSPKKGNFWGDLTTSLWSGALKKAGVENDILVILLKHSAKSRNTKILNSFISYCKDKEYQYIFLPSGWSSWLIQKAKKTLKSEIYFLQSGQGLEKVIKSLNINFDQNYFFKNFTPNFDYNKFFGVTVRPHQTISQISDFGCPHRARLKNNPFYKDLNDSIVKTWRGCTYCPAALHCLEMPLEKKTKLLESELIYLEKHLPYLKEISLSSPDDFFDCFEKFELSTLRPVSFHIQLRPDVIVEREKQIEKILTSMKKQKFSFYLSNVGFENFSNKELLVLNRNYKPEINIRALEVLKYFSQKYPEALIMKDTVASFILFEPLTTLKDLKINIDTILKLKDKFKLFFDMNFNRVRIDENVALYYLAKSKGLILQEAKESDSSELSDLPRGGYCRGDIKYRFADKKISWAYNLFHQTQTKSANLAYKIEILKRIFKAI